MTQNILGGQSTRPSAIPGLPTSNGQVIGPSSRLDNIVAYDPINIVDPYYGLTPEQIEALGSADPTDPYIRARLGIPQISEIERPPVVNPLSNQIMVGTDDSGDSAFTSEFFAASTNETPRLLDALDSTQEP